MSIIGNFQLPSLAGLQQITFISEILEIGYNDSLVNCFSGLSGLIGFTDTPGSPSTPAFTGVGGTVTILENGSGCQSPAEVLSFAQSLAVAPLESRGGTPTSAPMALPAEGGKIFYRATGTSHVDDAFTMDFWPSVELPSGQVVTRRNPFSLSAPAEGAGTFDSGLNFHSGLPSGTYTLRFYMGTHARTSNDGAWETTTFEVEKAAARMGMPTLSESEIAAMDFDELFEVDDLASASPSPDGAQSPEGAAATLATEAVLGQAYPNPFNPTATVPFTLSQDGDVRLAVYDLLGREVAVLAQGRMAAGSHTAVFDAGHLSTGTYLVRFSAPDGNVQTQRLTLLK